MSAPEGSMERVVGLRLLTLVAAVAVAAYVAAAAAGSSQRVIPDWAAPQIKTVVSHRLMGATSVSTFRPNAALTRGALTQLASGLQQELSPPPSSPLAIASETLTNDETVSGSVDWEATTSGPTPNRVEFWIDGTLGWTEHSAPYVFGGDGGTWDTTTVADGTYILTVKAYSDDGQEADATISVTVANQTVERVPRQEIRTGMTSSAAAGQAADAPVTMAELDRTLVVSLGLMPAAKEFSAGARAAGLTVPNRFGTEVVARLLGLRLNHPQPQDYLELRPQDTATRAEAAYSAAQMLGFGDLAESWQIEWVKAAADSFSLPSLNLWQKRILAVAFSKIGMPYVWGGTSDYAEAPFGVPSRGGYDCSGFVWRVYKLQSYPDEGSLAAVIRGRTTYTMSVEVPWAKRIPFKKLEPADVIFFGAQGPRSSGAEIDHTGIYVGNGWFINSSGEGVALAQLSGWYKREFAWGRRPLHEAGLEP
jgi:cell wall-associated NlpC family hydrolase